MFCCKFHWGFFQWSPIDNKSALVQFMASCWTAHNPLTHWGRVTHICVSKPPTIGSDNGLVAWSALSHYLNQCWNIVNLTLMNKLQWNFNRNCNIFIQENVFASVVCEMAVMLSRPQCVNWTKLSTITKATWHQQATMSYSTSRGGTCKLHSETIPFIHAPHDYSTFVPWWILYGVWHTQLAQCGL